MSPTSIDFAPRGRHAGPGLQPDRAGGLGPALRDPGRGDRSRPGRDGGLAPALVLAVRVQRHKQDVPALVAWSRFLAGSQWPRSCWASLPSFTCCLWAACPARRDSTKRSYGPGIRPTRRSCSPRVWYSPFVLPPSAGGGRGPGRGRGSSTYNRCRQRVSLRQSGGRRLKSAVIVRSACSASASTEAALAAAGNKVAAYVSLTKPRIVVMVLVTVGVGFLLVPAAAPSRDAVADLARDRPGGRWCQHAEPVDGTGAYARMRRTANRALPRGRLVRSRPPRSGSGWGWRARRSCSGVPTGWLPRWPSPRSCFTSSSTPR